ncbi:MAG: VOC family protein [Nitrospirae bacterium]|nr:VOC family protein [Nitrospirota bacterium]
MLIKLTTNMMVDDVQKTLKFYKESLNFDFVMGVPQDKNEVIVENDFKRKLVYAFVKHGSIEIMFQAKESLSNDISYFKNKSIGASISFYFEVDDVNSTYEKLKNKVKIVKDIFTTWYGMREFYISDCNGYILGFAKQEQ